MKRFLLGLLAVGFLLVGVAPTGAQDLQFKANLQVDVSRDETMLWLDRVVEIAPDRPLLIESRDGSLSQSYVVHGVYADYVLLKAPLAKPFPAGSRIFQ